MRDERDGGRSWSVWSIRSVSSVWLGEPDDSRHRIDQMNQIDQKNQMNKSDGQALGGARTCSLLPSSNGFGEIGRACPEEEERADEEIHRDRGIARFHLGDSGLARL